MACTGVVGVVAVVGVVGVLCIGVLEVDCVGVVGALVFGVVFMVKVVEGVELVMGCVVRCVVRLVLWCVNGRGHFLHCFIVKSVEMNRLRVVDGDLGGLFYSFRAGFLGQDGRHGCIVGHGGC